MLGKFYYFKRQHRGGLKESMETMVGITEEEFKKLLPMYEFYAFDDRVHQFLWILNDMEHNYKDYYVWIGIGFAGDLNNYVRS